LGDTLFLFIPTFNRKSYRRAAITYIAPVGSIHPWQDTAKVVINFSAPAKQIGPIKLLAGGRVGPLFGPRYTNHEKLESAKTLDEAF
jgi:hypothetical protein